MSSAQICWILAGFLGSGWFLCGILFRLRPWASRGRSSWSRRRRLRRRGGLMHRPRIENLCSVEWVREVARRWPRSASGGGPGGGEHWSCGRFVRRDFQSRVKSGACAFRGWPCLVEERACWPFFFKHLLVGSSQLDRKD